MSFWLKKFISFWLMPLPFCLTLLVAGLWLNRGNRKNPLGRCLLAAGVLLLLLFSNKAASVWLVTPLERLYPPIPELAAADPLPEALGHCRFVVVLGSGHGDSPGLSATNQLSPAGLERIVEGVRIFRRLPGASLIVSGPAVGDNPSHASVLARAAVALGVDPGRILRIETARDTEDESQACQRLVGAAPIALVTSAAHMPRAAALFRAAGVQVLACPTDYSARSNRDFRWNDLTWDVDSLNRSTWAVRERIGYLWLRLQGKVE